MFIFLLDQFVKQPTPVQTLGFAAMLAMVAAVVGVCKLLCGLVDGVFDAIEVKQTTDR